MPAPSRDDVEKVLRPYHKRLRGVVERGWGEWLEIAAYRARKRLGPVLYPRTIANHVFDAIARRAMQEFAEDASVHIRPESQTLKLYFGAGVLLRFKKGDDGLLGHNIPTQSVLEFLDPDGVLPGLPPETAKVEITWRANEIHTRLEHVNVVARDGSRLLWEYEIGLEDGSAEIIPFPPAPDRDDDAPLVRPKVRPAAKVEGDKS